MVSGQHLHPVGGGQNRRVIAAPRQNLGTLRCGHRRQGCRQICRPQLGTAAAAKRLGAHRLGQAQGRLAGKIARHRRVVGKFLHKGAVDAVFPLPKPTAIQRQAPFVGDSPAPACRDQLEVIALRRVAAHPPAREGCAQIGQQNRRLAHGIDPRLGPWRKAQMRAIACGKNRRIRALQRRPHSDKAFVCFDPDLGQPVLRPPPRHRQGEIRGQAPPVFQQHRIGLDRHRFGPGDQRHPGLRQMLQQDFARAAPDQRQRTGPALHQRDLAAPAQAIGRSQRQLDPADARADDCDLGAWQIAGDKAGPAFGIIAQGLGRDAMRVIARDLRQIRSDADIKACDIIRQRRAVLQNHLPRVAVQPDHPIQDHPRAGKARQPHKVDHNLVAAVMACNMSGQHAGIGRHGSGVDHRHPHACQGLHRPHPQHQSMGMAAPDQHQIFDYGIIVAHLALILAAILTGAGCKDHGIPLRLSVAAGAGSA